MAGLDWNCTVFLAVLRAPCHFEPGAQGLLGNEVTTYNLHPTGHGLFLAMEKVTKKVVNVLAGDCRVF